MKLCDVYAAVPPPVRKAFGFPSNLRRFGGQAARGEASPYF